jgi:hypothetical protein
MGGTWYFTARLSGALQPTFGAIYCTPILISKNITADRIGTHVLVGAGTTGSIRYGIYQDNGKMLPGNLILDAGKVSGIVSQSAVFLEVVISQSLNKGTVYWLVAAFDGITKIPGANNLGAFNQLLGFDNATVVGSSRNVNLYWYSTSSATASLPPSLPSTFGSYNVIYDSNIPDQVYIRASY